MRQVCGVTGLLGALAVLNACSDQPGITPPRKIPPPIALVSEPLALQAAARQQSPAGIVTAASAERLVYVSLSSGAHPGGSSVTIRNTAGGPTVMQTMINGGFDPVPIPAGVGDTIRIVVRDSAGGASTSWLPVPRLLKPSVVRTSPSDGKRDVPLNSRVVIVFSEPVDSASVKLSVALLRSGVPVPGVVGLFPGGVVAEFVPSTLLERRTTYRVEVTQGVKDLGGEPLTVGLSAEFTTGDSAVAPVTAVTVAPPNATLEMGDVQGDTVRLAATVMTATDVVTDRLVIWSTSNPTVAVVSSTGLVTPLATGTATITATSEGQTGSAQITVVPIPVARVSLYVADFEITPLSGTMDVGSTLLLGASTFDRYGRFVSSRVIVWTSGDTTVARVDQRALVTGRAIGTAPITATSEGVSATMPVRVGLPLLVDRVEITPRVTVLSVRGSVQLTAHAYKCDAQAGTCSEVTAPAITWASGDTGVATVDQTGRVTGLTSGMSAITARLDQIRGTAPITVLSAAPPTFAAVATGAYFTCGLAVTSAAYCWGRNSFAELGIGILGLGLHTRLQEDAPAGVAPLPVAGGLTFASLSVGAGWHACALTNSGAAYCWGLALRNRLAAPGSDTCGYTSQGGDTVWMQCAPRPIAVQGAPLFRAIYAGGNHTCALTAAGAAYCWGNDRWGQVGDGGGVTGYGLPPSPVAGGHTFASLTTGQIHTCGLTPEGTAYCWGYNYDGELGDGTYANRDAPVAVAGGLTFASLSAGGYSTCGVTTTGQIYCWGDSYYGQLGDGSFASRNVPGAIAGGPFAKVSVGTWHACALTPTGVSYCWGANWTGSLGDGSGVNQSTPVPVAGGLTFASIATGDAHTCGVTTTQAVYCWGANVRGQLGDGSAINRRTPTRVVGQP